MNLGEYLHIRDKNFTIKCDKFIYHQNGDNNTMIFRKDKVNQFSLNNLFFPDRSPLSKRLFLPIIIPNKPIFTHHLAGYPYMPGTPGFYKQEVMRDPRPEGLQHLVIQYNGEVIYEETIHQDVYNTRCEQLPDGYIINYYEYREPSQYELSVLFTYPHSEYGYKVRDKKLYKLNNDEYRIVGEDNQPKRIFYDKAADDDQNAFGYFGYHKYNVK